MNRKLRHQIPLVFGERLVVNHIEVLNADDPSPLVAYLVLAAKPTNQLSPVVDFITPLRCLKITRMGRDSNPRYR